VKLRADTTLILCAAALLLLVAVVYGDTLRASFQFDDYNVIVDNPAVHSWPAWYRALPALRPLLKLSYTANWLLSPQPWAFHLFNVLCHALNVLLVFALGRRLFRSELDAALLALIAAAVFALHPAQTEAVTYISGRSVALMAVFYLGGLLAGCSAGRVLPWLVSPLLFAAALLTKETAWTLPLALLLLQRQRELPLRDNLLRLIPHLVAGLAVAALFAVTPAYARLLRHSVSIRPLWENLALQVDGWFYLLTRPLLLLQTNIDPDLPTHTLFSTYWALQLLVLVMALVLIVQWRRQLLGFALLWFFLHLLPTNSLLPRNDVANDRQLYLALIGPAWLLASALCAALNQRLAVPFAALLMLSLGGATLTRNRDYRNEIQLWQVTALRSPNKARVWNNLGYAYQLAGLGKEARAAYQQALRLDPQHERARINLMLLEPVPGLPQSDPAPASR
jgi:tetratricopeptide (TPR) repeat protein